MFQFTHPGRGATQFFQLGDVEVAVSIHAPREGCDCAPVVAFADTISFNSRTPGGVRLPLSMMSRAPLLFQFTHPGRGATPYTLDNGTQDEVSIHAPREGCDDAYWSEVQGW